MIFQKYSKILKYLIFFQLSCLLLGNEKLYLQKAKVLESKFLEDKNVKSISGDVVFTKGNLTLNCQEGLQYEKDGIAIFNGTQNIPPKNFAEVSIELDNFDWNLPIDLNNDKVIVKGSLERSRDFFLMDAIIFILLQLSL